MILDTRAVRVLMAQNDIRTQRELAERIGISQNAISDLLSGDSQPSIQTVGDLCLTLHCLPNDILHFAPGKELALAGI